MFCRVVDAVGTNSRSVRFRSSPTAEWRHPGEGTSRQSLACWDHLPSKAGVGSASRDKDICPTVHWLIDWLIWRAAASFIMWLLPTGGRWLVRRLLSHVAAGCRREYIETLFCTCFCEYGHTSLRNQPSTPSAPLHPAIEAFCILIGAAYPVVLYCLHPLTKLALARPAWCLLHAHMHYDQTHLAQRSPLGKPG